MKPLSVTDLARVSFPGNKGVFAMLACYLDDSGTHTGSSAIVWGGLIGHMDFFDRLNASWLELLQDPCDGRPPISAFHSSELASGRGEFLGYSQGERDHARYKFRKAIIDSGVTAVAYAASLADWNRLITGKLRTFMGTPERWICAEAVSTGCDMAKEHSLPISFQFDIERRSESIDMMIEIAKSNAPGVTAHVGFASVKSVPALQAADMVAHQTYQHFIKTRLDSHEPADAHMLRLMEDAYDWGVKVFDVEALAEIKDEITPLVEQFDHQLKHQ